MANDKLKYMKISKTKFRNALCIYSRSYIFLFCSDRPQANAFNANLYIITFIPFPCSGNRKL